MKCFLFFSETDDYAEIIDEEDTYTMPSSKHTSTKRCLQLMWLFSCMFVDAVTVDKVYGFLSGLFGFYS